MAITDARLKRTLKISETVGDNGINNLSGSEDYIVISDTANPAFADVLDNTTSWANLGSRPLPQLYDEITVSGKTLFVSSRDVSYADEDNDRVVVMAVKYSAKDDSGQDNPAPSGTSEDTWHKISVRSQQVSVPARGWRGLAEVPAQDNGTARQAQNSAGDPVDGIEEDVALISYTYNNPRVLNPDLGALASYVNICNFNPFLGGNAYTVRCVGYSADYDEKNKFWVVSVEFLYKYDGWEIVYFDAGFNELIDGKRVAIVDDKGNPVSKPVPLDGTGRAIDPVACDADVVKPTCEAVTLKRRVLYPYPQRDLNTIWDQTGIR